MYSLKSKNLAWLAPAAMLLFTAGCPVDANEEKAPDADENGPPPECMAADAARIRILQAAKGLGTLMRPGRPDVTQTLSLTRANPADPESPLVLSNNGFGATANASVCPGMKTIIASTQVLDGEMIKDGELGKVDIDIAAKERITLVVTGFVAPAAGQDSVKFVVIRESKLPAREAGKSNLIVANAIPDSPTVAVDFNPAAGAEIAALARYGVSDVVAVETPEKAVTVKVLEGDAAKVSFSISPRFPAGANLIAVLYDTLAIPMNGTKPSSKLFLTGDDPLIGNAPGSGIIFPAL